MWGTLIIIIYLIPFIRFTFKEKTTDTYFKQILYLLGGIIAGWTNENMAVALLTMLLIFAIYFKYSIGTIPKWVIVGLTGVFIGAVIMIIAPGNYARMESVIGVKYADQSNISIIISRISGSIAGFYYYVLPPFFIFLITLWTYLYFGIKSNKKKVLFLAYLFIIGAIIATIAMAASPIFPGRASFGINIFIFIATGILFANLDFEQIFIKRITYTILIFGFLLFIADYYRGYRTMKDLDTHLKARMENIIQLRNENVRDIVLDDRVFLESRFLHYFELTSDSTDWHNRMFSGYYDLNTIIIK